MQNKIQIQVPAAKLEDWQETVDILAESIKDQGSTFRILLPVFKDEAPNASEEEQYV